MKWTACRPGTAVASVSSASSSKRPRFVCPFGLARTGTTSSRGLFHASLAVRSMMSLAVDVQIPIICICNDPTTPKMRSFANYCMSLKFRRPEARLIASKLRTVAFRCVPVARVRGTVGV